MIGPGVAIPRLLARIAIAAALLASSRAATADTVTLRGSAIPLRSCVVQDLKSGRLYFRGGGNLRQHREIDEVVALGFTGLPALDEAERLLRENDLDGGLAKMLEALVAADAEVERLWIHIRLAQIHDQRNELVPAAGHAAAVFLLRDEAYWQRLAPRSTNTWASYPAAVEAMTRLEEAKRSVRNRSLLRVVGRLIATIAPVRDALAGTWEGGAVAPGTTESGFLIDRIRAGEARPEMPVLIEAPDDLLPAPTAPELPPAGGGPARVGTRSPVPAPERARPPSSPTGSRAPEPGSASDDPDAVDAALAAGREAEALAMCERIAARPGDRDLDRFLHQYGRTLRAADRPGDAAVMFMRVVVLFDESPYAVSALLDTAVICRDTFANAAAAARLTRRAIDLAEGRADAAGARRGREILATLGAGKNR